MRFPQKKVSIFAHTSGQSRCWLRRICAARRDRFRDILHVLFDLANLRVHFADQIMLGLRYLFDARRHFMQFFQHRILA